MAEMPDKERKARIRCVLWDMDGTLLDSERVYNLCCAEYAARRGYPELTEAFFAGFCGMSPEKTKREMQGEFFRRRIPLDPEEVERQRVSGYLEWIREHGVPVFPGAYRVLGILGSMHVLQAVCTSSAYGDAHQSLETSGILPKLDAVVYGTEIEHPKPAPDIFLAAARRLGVRPEDCLVVEDSPAGAEAAVRAGMRLCMKKGSGQTSEGMSVSSLHEILKWFEGAEYGS